jgi:hypothetical protein
LFDITGVLTPTDDVIEPLDNRLFLNLTLPLISTANPSIDDGIVQNGKVITTNPKDTLIATQNPSELLPEQQGLQALSNAFGLDKISSLFGTAGNLLAPDSVKFDQLIAEIKGLRSDLAAGKVAVYMDTEKVTSKIGKQVDQSSRNNYSLGQA